MRPGITSHTIVRNEDRFIWFALNSVIDEVDQMLVYDTGSIDRTVEILQCLENPKLMFEQKGEADAQHMVRLRQEQLDRTETEWFIILDGDEVWWEGTIRDVRNIILNVEKETWGIITPTINCVGDIYHFQEQEAGRYEFKGRKGHYAVRPIRRTIPGLHVEGTYPLEGYKDASNTLITDYQDHLMYLDKPYLHLTNLSRSTNQSEKVISREKKYELGIPFPKDFRYPEVFYRQRPNPVPEPWVMLSNKEKTLAAIQTPVKKIKRRILK